MSRTGRQGRMIGLISGENTPRGDCNMTIPRGCMGSGKAPITRAKCRGEPGRRVTVAVKTQGGYKWPMMIYVKGNSRQGKHVDGLRRKVCSMELQKKEKQNE
jgi:hypothetical protein